jgi:gamma-glutamyltranspeptidase/glutathione hydrolase
LYKEKDTIKYPALAATLRRISKNGRDEFYKGAATTLVVIFRKKEPITMEDLAQKKPKHCLVLNAYHIISMAPPSSGGICLHKYLK